MIGSQVVLIHMSICRLVDLPPWKHSSASLETKAQWWDSSKFCAPKICDLKTRVEFPTSVFATKRFPKGDSHPKKVLSTLVFLPQKASTDFVFRVAAFLQLSSSQVSGWKTSFFFLQLFSVVATQIFWEFSPRTLGKIPNLTNVFEMGWNHQLVLCVFFPQDVKALHEALGNTDDALAASLVPWTRVGKSQMGEGREVKWPNT